MSWPADGKPRFVTSEMVDGGPINAAFGRSAPGGLEVSVHDRDRGCAFRVVEMFSNVRRSQGLPAISSVSRKQIRQAAERFCQALNETHDPHYGDARDAA